MIKSGHSSIVLITFTMLLNFLFLIFSFSKSSFKALFSCISLLMSKLCLSGFSSETTSSKSNPRYLQALYNTIAEFQLFSDLRELLKDCCIIPLSLQRRYSEISSSFMRSDNILLILFITKNKQFSLIKP